MEQNLREVPEDLTKQVLEDAMRAKLILELSGHFLDSIPKAVQAMFKSEPTQNKT